jgi:hypothetical protein
MQHDGVGTYYGIVSNTDLTKDFGSSPNIDTVANYRCVLGVIEAVISYRYTLAQNTIVADDRATMNNNPGLVFDRYATSQSHAVGQLNTVDVSAVTKQGPIQEAQRCSQ